MKNEENKDVINIKHDCEHDAQSHSHKHIHAHVHDPNDKKKRLARISRIIGHLEHVKQMIENDDDCSDILMQISAVKSALNGLGKTIINEHMTHCIVHAIESGDSEAVEEFQEAIQKYL